MGHVKHSGVVRVDGGPRLAWHRWAPEDPHGCVVVLHGLGDHGACYGRLAERLTAAGLSVVALDYEGFGASEGRRGDVRFEPTRAAVDRLLAGERERIGDLPAFVYGHSLGGLYALLYAVEREGALAGVVLSAPAIESTLRAQPLKLATARVLGRVWPHLGLRNGLRFDHLNRDPAVVAARAADPLIHRRVTARFVTDTLAQMDRAVAAAARLRTPMLVVHGDADLVNPLSGSRAVVEAAPGDATLNVYPGAYHALEDEPEAPAIADDVAQWMSARYLHNW